VANNQPKEMGLIEALQHFLHHRADVIRRRTAYLLNKAQDREHILEGYLTALDHLDNVITIIRASANRGDARDNLVAYFAVRKSTSHRGPGAEDGSGKALLRRSRPRRFSNCNCIA